MAKIYQTIAVAPLNPGTAYSHPPTPPEVAHLDDPAADIMLDFVHANAFTIAPDAPIPEAAMEMRVCHTHLLLVVNKEDEIIGMITSEDLLGEKTLKIMQEKRIKRPEVLIHQVMTRQDQITTIDIAELRHAKVGDLIQTLHSVKQHYALGVEVDASSGKQTVRGMFSLSQISKQLGCDVTSDLGEALSLAELHSALN